MYDDIDFYDLVLMVAHGLLEADEAVGVLIEIERDKEEAAKIKEARDA